jgi:hypothetical protein
VEADVVLRPALVSRQDAPDKQWHCILLFLFWQRLFLISNRLRRLDEDDNSRNSQVYWSFLHALHRSELLQRPARLGLKILNDVQHDVRFFYRREREYGSPLDPVTDDKDEDQEDGTRCSKVLAGDDDGFTQINLQHDVRAVRRWLKQLVRRGRLSKPDYLIFVGSYVYGHSLQTMASRLGLTYEATRKRRQRAEKFLQKNASGMSPTFDLPPL